MCVVKKKKKQVMQFNIKLHKLPMSELVVFYRRYRQIFFQSAFIDFSFSATWGRQKDHENKTSTYHLMRSLQLTSKQTVGWNTTRHRAETFLCPPDEWMSPIHSPFSFVLVSTSCWEQYLDLWMIFGCLMLHCWHQLVGILVRLPYCVFFKAFYITL